MLVPDAFREAAQECGVLHILEDLDGLALAPSEDTMARGRCDICGNPGAGYQEIGIVERNGETVVVFGVVCEVCRDLRATAGDVAQTEMDLAILNTRASEISKLPIDDAATKMAVLSRLLNGIGGVYPAVILPNKDRGVPETLQYVWDTCANMLSNEEVSPKALAMFSNDTLALIELDMVPKGSWEAAVRQLVLKEEVKAAVFIGEAWAAEGSPEEVGIFGPVSQPVRDMIGAHEILILYAIYISEDGSKDSITMRQNVAQTGTRRGLVGEPNIHHSSSTEDTPDYAISQNGATHYGAIVEMLGTMLEPSREW